MVPPREAWDALIIRALRLLGFISASTVSFSEQCEAETGSGLAAAHVCASCPRPITGKAVMRSRAAPMGISVTVSVGSSDFTGLGCSLPTRPSESCFHAGMRFAFDLEFDGRGRRRERLRRQRPAGSTSPP